MSKRILVADDDPAIVDSTKLLLEMEGFSVDTAVNGHTIMKAMEMKPDLVLLDIWMSGLYGGDIAEQLKRHEDTKRIPIIMISANRDAHELSRKCGADGFLAKPFEAEDLLNAVNACITSL